MSWKRLEKLLGAENIGPGAEVRAITLYGLDLCHEYSRRATSAANVR